MHRKLKLAFVAFITFSVLLLISRPVAAQSVTWQQWWTQHYPLPTQFTENASSYGIRFKWLIWFRKYITDQSVTPAPTAAGSAVTTAGTITTTSFNDFTTGTGQNQFEFVGTWNSSTAYPDMFSGDYHYTYNANDYYQFRFTGTQIKIYTWAGHDTGKAAISIDGGAETTVDTYSDPESFQKLIYTSPMLPNGAHTLKVRATGQQNEAAVNSTIVADKVEVISQTAPPSTAVPTSGANLTADPCRLAGPGDSDCNGIIDMNDYEILRRSTSVAAPVSLLYDAWRSAFVQLP